MKDAIGGDHRFLGATIDVATFNLEVNDVMKVTLGVIAQKDQMVDHWGPPSSGLAMAGFGFDEIEHFRFDPDGAESAVDLTAFTRSMAISYSNGIQADQGVRFGSRFPRELPVGAAEAMVRATLVFKDIKAHQMVLGASLRSRRDCGSQPGKYSGQGPTRRRRPGILHLRPLSGVPKVCHHKASWT